jgi:hypothetical protein
LKQKDKWVYVLLGVGSCLVVIYTHKGSKILCDVILKRYEMAGEWRKLHEELNDLYCSPNIVWVIKSRRMSFTGHVARMGDRRGVYRFLVGKPKRERPLGRPRRRWEDNIKMVLQGWGYGLDPAGLG